ncbi:hypothetical protein F66182_2139 [Fusarium sp. NRRL 66182]|nr:hypothetical protein F66182_2139 [Fusarium sp. NRRL 66182]
MEEVEEVDGGFRRVITPTVAAVPTASGCRLQAQLAQLAQLERGYSSTNTPTSPIKSAAPPPLAFASRIRSQQTSNRHRHSLPSPTLASPSPQKEPGADGYLDKLLRLARYDSTGGQRTRISSAMADFLASFNLGAQTPAASSNPQCDSVEELQFQLRGILDAKATPTRAEHVSITIELRATVRFQLAVSESENGTLEGLNSIEPLLGGAQPPVGTNAGQDGSQLSRVVFANDTLMNQPHDDPALQRSVAKHIISIISSTDGSTWTVREVSRGTQGWTLTYLCKDSYQQWARQNSKNPTKTVVGEFSQRDPDPVLHTRPAFDCRGAIVISFNRNSRSITIKYDHTPLHKTVAELAAHFKPPPRQLGPGAQKLQEQQKKAKEKTPKKSRGEKRERKKRESLKAQDENGNPRKRKKKNNSASQAVDLTNGPMIPPDYPGASAVDGQTQAGPSYSNNGQALASGQDHRGFNDYPPGLVGGDTSATTNGTASQQAASIAFPVNVSAAEAARRREAATAILSNAGVDPTTLSPEQFGIFANQAPELQRESLNMLVKYGAERLRIVHPGNREDSAQGNTSPIAQTNKTTSNGPRTTKELVPQSNAQSNINTDTSVLAASETADETSTPKSKARKMGKSRTACFPCKARKTKKCPRERPTCTECTTHGTACEYAPQKPRNRGKEKKTKKSEAIVVNDDDDDEEEEEEEEGGEEEEEEEEEEQEQEEEQQDAEEEAPDQEEEEDDDGDEEEEQEEQNTSQDYSYPQMNIGNMVTNTSGSGLGLPQPDSYSTNQQPLSTSSGMTVSQRDNYHALPEVTHPMHHPPPPIPAPAGTVAPAETRWWTPFGSSNKTRRSLPSEPPHSTGQTVPAPNPQPSDWAQSSNTTMPPTTMAPVSSQGSYDTRSGQRTQHANSSMANDAPQQAAAMPSKVMQQARQSPVAAAAMMAQARKSPYQQQVAVPRTTSRTSQRNQSRTPAADHARGYQPPPELSQQQNARASAQYDASHMASGSGYNDYGRYTSTSSATSHQPAMSVASATPTTTSTSYQSTSSTANQWSTSSSRNDRSYGTSSSYQAPAGYSQPASSKPASVSRQNFNMRASTQHHTRANSGSYNQQQQQQQQQSYPSYSGPANQNQQGQAPSQQQSSWYFQNSHNPSIHPGGQSSGYNYEPW